MKKPGTTLEIVRRIEEPKLETGTVVPISEDQTGTVEARYVPSGKPDEVRYIVRVDKPNTETVV
jgi:hypothetical protein